MKKILGYILAVVGLIGIAAWAVPQFGEFAQGFYKSYAGNEAPLNLTVVLLIGAVLAVVGVLFITKGGGRRKVSEVPIYHGKDVIGYRVHGKR